jgi:hypothetical protein
MRFEIRAVFSDTACSGKTITIAPRLAEGEWLDQLGDGPDHLADASGVAVTLDFAVAPDAIYARHSWSSSSTFAMP